MQLKLFPSSTSTVPLTWYYEKMKQQIRPDLETCFVIQDVLGKRAFVVAKATSTPGQGPPVIHFHPPYPVTNLITADMMHEVIFKATNIAGLLTEGFCGNKVGVSLLDQNATQPGTLPYNKMTLRSQKIFPTTKEEAYQNLLCKFARIPTGPPPPGDKAWANLEKQVNHHWLIRVLQEFQGLASHPLNFEDYGLGIPDETIPGKGSFFDKTSALFCLLLTNPSLETVQEVHQMYPQAVMENYQYNGSAYTSLHASLMAKPSDQVVHFIYNCNPLQHFVLNNLKINAHGGEVVNLLLKNAGMLQTLDVIFLQGTNQHDQDAPACVDAIINALLVNPVKHLRHLKLFHLPCIDWDMVHLPKDAKNKALRSLELRHTVNPSKSFLTGILTVCPLLKKLGLELCPNEAGHHDLELISSLQGIESPNLGFLNLNIQQYKLNQANKEAVYGLLHGHNKSKSFLYLTINEPGGDISEPDIVEEFQKEVLNILQVTANASLTWFCCNDCNEFHGLRYYVQLSQMGRHIARHTRTEKAIFVKILANASDPPQSQRWEKYTYNPHDIQYGLLRENPSLWATSAPVASNIATTTILSRPDPPEVKHIDEVMVDVCCWGWMS